MSKFLLICSLFLAAGGCASEAQHARQPMTAPPVAYVPASAPALAFDPPAVIGQPMPSFARDGRGPAAFAGYEQQVTTFTYTHQRDEVRVYNDFGTLKHTAYTDRTSITTR